MEEKTKPLTAHDIMRGIGGKGKWNIEPPTEAERAIANKPAIMIANVGPESFTVALGNLGTFVIPPCSDRSIGILYVNRIVFDTEVDIEKTVNVQDFEGGPWRMVPAFKHVSIDGMEVAKEIIGTAKYRHPSENLEQWGVFIAAAPEATREEIEAARSQLHASYSRLTMEIGMLIGNYSVRDISDRHMRALVYVRRSGRLTA